MGLASFHSNYLRYISNNPPPTKQTAFLPRTFLDRFKASGCFGFFLNDKFWHIDTYTGVLGVWGTRRQKNYTDNESGNDNDNDNDVSIREMITTTKTTTKTTITTTTTSATILDAFVWSRRLKVYDAVHVSGGGKSKLSFIFHESSWR